ncbi:hypothetical protein [Streptomyces sp. NPDC048309]|uniref:hypothetical protein n=1 Tax=Streptomyces sp. NPDC048309 TaxID=3154618 RepID=UPI0033E90214
MKISTRMQVRPAFEEVLNSAREVKAYAPQRRVIFTVYDMKRLGRDAAELTAHDTVLEMFAGPLPRHLRRTDPGRLSFPFFPAAAEIERENIRTWFRCRLVRDGLHSSLRHCRMRTDPPAKPRRHPG